MRRRLDALPGPAFADARRDVAEQLGRLVFPRLRHRHRACAGWPTSSATCAPPSAVSSASPDAVNVDRDRMRAVQELEDAYRRRLEPAPRGAAVAGPLAEVPWMLEELRVHHFAQALGTRGRVSNKRIRQVLAESAR